MVEEHRTMWLQLFFSDSMQDITCLLISAFSITTVQVRNEVESAAWLHHSGSGYLSLLTLCEHYIPFYRSAQSFDVILTVAGCCFLHERGTLLTFLSFLHVCQRFTFASLYVCKCDFLLRSFLERRCNPASSAVINHSNTFVSSST